MNPEHVAESDHRITHPEFPDYREPFRKPDIKSKRRLSTVCPRIQDPVPWADGLPLPLTKGHRKSVRQSAQTNGAIKNGQTAGVRAGQRCCREKNVSAGRRVAGSTMHSRLIVSEERGSQSAGRYACWKSGKHRIPLYYGRQMTESAR